ncbi:APC family permease [Lactovum miscens]|uniref:Amino acid transporter n=1 Tax=Lactovum miscens TaxID=190387 RepID=A0A841C2N7_9LACT|nr:APC family permease [Lactovum miscens]MBB5888226.1 amino acid transporter [Lactovum miscens]
MKNDKLMSPFAVFLLGINSIIGSGIFLLAGKIYKDAGTLSLLAIILASLSILVISFSYANMARIYPENGGAFVYAKDTFGLFAGYIVGMGVWIQSTVTLAAEVAALMTAGQMLDNKLPVKELGLGLILALGLVSYFGSGIISKLDNLTSIVKIAIVLLFVFGTIWFTHKVNFSNVAFTGGINGFLAAYGAVFFFFPGFAFLPVNAEKMRNPRRTLPIMLVAVILTCMGVYVAIHAITIGVLGSTLPNYAVPAAIAFEKLFGNLGLPVIIVGICISILGVIITATFNAPVILASLAKDHEDVPSIVAQENKFGAATLAILLTIFTAAILFSIGNFVFLSGLTVFMSFVQYLSTGISNIKEKFFKVGLATILLSIILLFSFNLQVLEFGFGILIILSFIYFVIKLLQAI